MSVSILLVDDDQDSLGSLEAMLLGQFRVLTAGPAAAMPTALRLWREHPELQLAIVDLDMPGAAARPAFAGAELIGQLKELHPRARIAVCSGHEDHEDLAEAARQGADSFFGKDCSHDETLVHVNLLVQWLTVGETLRALAMGIDFRLPRTAGHSDRVRELCRALAINLKEADPKNFDLAACLIAAELHDLGKVGLPDDVLSGEPPSTSEHAHHLLEQHTEFASSLRHLGPAFEKVARIISLHHRCYADPPPGSRHDYPHSPNLPRKEMIPLEARVLRVADVLDNFLTSPPGYDVERARMLIDEGANQVFCPLVVNALERLLVEDRERFDRIYPPIGHKDQAGLLLSYQSERATAGQLQTILTHLSRVYLPGGRATDCLLLVGVSKEKDNGRTVLQVHLAGEPRDIDAALEHLERYRHGRLAQSRNAHLADDLAWEPIPDAIKRLPPRLESP